MWYINGTRLDDRIVRTDWDAGFVEGRQYGRGKSGGQVRTSRFFLTNHLELCQADCCILSSCPSSHSAPFWPIRPALISYLVISSMRQQGVFILPPGRNASLLLGYPQNYLNPPLPICTLGWKVALGEKCLYQEHNMLTAQKCCDA